VLWGSYTGRRSRRLGLSPTAWRRCLIGGVAVAVLITQLPDRFQPAAQIVVLLAAAGAAVVGLARHHARSAPPWLLLLLARGVGVGALCLGYVHLPGVTASGTAAGALMLLPYPLLAASMLLVTWRRPTPWCWTEAIHVAIFATGLGLLSWSLLVLPLARADRLAELHLGLLVCCAALDLVGLVAGGRAVTVQPRRSPATLLLGAAVVAAVLADVVVVRLDTMTGEGWALPAAITIGLVTSVLLAAACLHPSISRRDPYQPAEVHDDVADVRLGTSAALVLLACGTPVVAAGLVGGEHSWSETALSAVLTGVFCSLLMVRLGVSTRRVHGRAANLARRVAVLDGQARGLSDKATALDVVLQEHREQQRDLEYLATHDTVTMLANRTLFGQRLDRAMDLVGHHTGVALLLLDLDGFKAVNDTLGHLVGDQLLRVVAQRLLGVVPSTQTVARLGGDEFAILITGVREADEAWALAQEVLKAISSPYAFGDKQVSVTVSIGIRHLPRFRSESPMDMMEHADTAMYAAKRSGKNRASLYGRDPEPLPGRASHRLEPANNG